MVENRGPAPNTLPRVPDAADVGAVDAVVVGAGYVGLTLATHMAGAGLSVLAVDTDRSKIERFKDGDSAVYEDGFARALEAAIESNRLRFSSSADLDCATWILAISYFPGDAEQFTRVVSSLRAPADQIPLIVIRGTVPVGYSQSHVVPALEAHFEGPNDRAFHVVSAPERTLSGAALQELSRLPQLVGGTPASVERACRFFERCGIATVPLPSLEAGEMAKTFTNFARLVQFNLANFLGVLCHQFDLQEDAFLRAIRTGYPRLDFLTAPGPGVGGFCLPKDCLVLQEGLEPLAVSDADPDGLWQYPRQQFALNSQIIEFYRRRVCELTRDAKHVLAMGVAFKGRPRTNDTRDSVGLVIVSDLMATGRRVRVVDVALSRDEIAALGLEAAELPLDLSRFDAVLILNNEPEYGALLRSALDERPHAAVAVYDPWRQVVGRDESVFQTSYRGHLNLREG